MKLLVRVRNYQVAEVQVLRKRKWLWLFPQSLVAYNHNYVGYNGEDSYLINKTEWVSDKDIFEVND